MARLVRHFIEEPRDCSYLQSVKASLEYRLMVDVTPVELEELMLRGWRRFGPAYFRPACVPCGWRGVPNATTALSKMSLLRFGKWVRDGG